MPPERPRSTWDRNEDHSGRIDWRKFQAGLAKNEPSVVLIPITDLFMLFAIFPVVPLLLEKLRSTHQFGVSLVA
jgi:hypothetical protein